MQTIQTEELKNRLDAGEKPVFTWVPVGSPEESKKVAFSIKSDTSLTDTSIINKLPVEKKEIELIEIKDSE